MKTKKKKLVTFVAILVCFIFSMTTIVNNNFVITSTQNICADKTGDTTRRIKSV